MKRQLHLAFAFFILSGICLGQTKNTQNTVRLDEGRSGERAAIADMSWLTGSWTGTGLGGQSDEIWSQPSAGVMMGTYRLIKDGKPVFYEMMWLLESEGTVVLRLKHFSPDLVGWEEKDKTVDFKFVKKERNRAYFSGLTFERKNGKELNIFLALKQKDGTVREEVFKMKRIG